MAFDQPTRNRLARFVGDARALLSEEFTRQLQHEYGLDPTTGRAVELDRLTHLDDARRETARILRDTLAHYLAGVTKPTAQARQDALDRIVREQAYTVLNRLCALRMAEARGLLIASVGRGYQSRGFQLYARLAGAALGETGDAYRGYLFSLFDELAVDLAVLFDRFSPQGRLFPREAALLRLLDEINHPDIEPLWAEDETIGWIYQYFNSDDERRQMRAESQAPRNSRELAVRNQFFTPRYVVEFLTDNTLGRIWYEMTQGQTGLVETCRYLVRRPNEVFLAAGASPPRSQGEGDSGGEGENLSQEELLKQPVYIPHRPLKDPREIAMLDPACGSMHFGLYAFDLFERIYSEAWEMQASGRWAEMGGQMDDCPLLTAEYPSKDAFLRDVPRLIVERNIHGIDIDPRAVQIAGLSLWLRAQKSWQAQGLKPQERPQIRRSNVVCAEPMPGDKALLDEFLRSLRDDRLEVLIRRALDVPADQRVRATGRMAEVLCDLVRTVWQEMALAGEAGSLLKIEESLAEAVAQAEKAWLDRWPLFRAEFQLTEGAPQVRYHKTVPGEGTDFWSRAEALVVAALEEYAEQAQNGAGYQRRLFAEDAARGFAFVDLCRRHYDIALMNPPFGETSKQVAARIEKDVPLAKKNTYIASVVFGEQRLHPTGLLGAITDASFIHQTRYEEFREFLLKNRSREISCMSANGWGVLDSYVETASYVLKQKTDGFALFIDLREDGEHRADKLGAAIEQFREACLLQGCNFLPTSTFRRLPKNVLAFWLPVRILNAYRVLPSLDPSLVDARCGISSSDNFRFYKLWWEVRSEDISRRKQWVFLSNGGSPAPLFRQQLYLVNYARDGVEIKTRVKDHFGSETRTVINQPYYFRCGFTYGKRTDSLTVQFLPEGHVFSNEGQAIFPTDSGYTWNVLGYLNTSLVAFLLNSIAGQHKEAGYVGSIPAPPERFLETHWVESATRDNYYALAKCAQTIPEAQLFAWPLVWVDLSAPHIFQQAAATIISENKKFSQKFVAIDELLESTLGFTAQDALPWSHRIWDVVTILFDEGADKLEYLIAHDFVSFSIGVAFGRWDIQFAIGSKVIPELTDPLAPLPTCPSGMLQNDQGLPAAPADVPDAYPLRISWPGILVDDPGHPEDIEGRVREAIRVIWPERADAIEQEACEILGVPSLRAYFSDPNRFFDDHLKRYSKSRRYAPIYWPLSTPSGAYTLWLYYHRLSDQILYTCVNDFVDPKLAEVGRQVSGLRGKTSRSGPEEQALEQLADLERELQDFRAELLRIAAFWKPNLNDGVQITAAPLWRLFQHRGWQKRLQETWDKLEAGDYDWAHLAMSIWPARVVPKCVNDRSLAIAHDLEDLFWVEDAGGWRNLRAPEQEIADQKERQQALSRDLVRDLLGELAGGAGRGLPAYQVCQHLVEGDWDDLHIALCLWPERVADKCWADPPLSLRLGLDMPARRTETAHKRFAADLVSAGTPDLAGALVAALQEVERPFDALWAELERGDRDGEALALALWPDRVVDKCVTDVDLAARHDLCRFFWYKPPHGDWRRRKDPRREIADEIARRQTNTIKGGR